ncbi:hypothetical protein [Thermosinus carboxydivorans]|uniref:hypothetical protein n=1 Tax=Thermosinus carboxydivorans TaxID=261685 RepID=UPI0002F1E0E1|nr:hypothetical protein [Thermosinus carboxydivorans]
MSWQLYTGGRTKAQIKQAELGVTTALALTQAKTNHVQALYDYNVNKARLDKAIGLATELRK